MPTEANEAVARLVHDRLEKFGAFAPKLDRDELIVEIWTALDNAEGLP